MAARVGVSAKIEWRGNMRFVHDIIKRADPVTIQREVLFPWRRWVVEQRIPMMYQAKGAVPTEQPRWAKLSEWTYAMKGPSKNLLMLSSKQYGGTAMVKKYQIKWTSSGRNAYDIRLWNTARSGSKWSPGFNYPAALHTGWGPYTVKPRSDGPGVLVIPFMGSWRFSKKATIKTSKRKYALMRSRGVQGEVEFHAGRAGSRKRGGKTIKSWDTFSMFRMETHPTGAPARPHIRFFRMDALELAQRTVDWCMQGRRPGQGEGRMAA